MAEERLEDYIDSTDEECGLYISEALSNLAENYPHKGRASFAFGRLILGRLGWKAKQIVTIFPDEEHPYIRQQVSP